MNESRATKVVLCLVVVLLLILIYREHLRKKKEIGLLTVQGLCGRAQCLSQSSSVALSDLNIQSRGPASQAPWYGDVESDHVRISTAERSCSLSGLSVVNLHVDDEKPAPHFLLHFGHCNNSAPTEMVMMAEVTTGGPCGLRQWLCDISPPFACHTTVTTTSFTQTSTLHLQKESLQASFQNPSLRCLGDKDYISWATSNEKCAQATLLRHNADSKVCAYHFAGSQCYVFSCRQEYGDNFGDVTFCYELLTFDWERRLHEQPLEPLVEVARDDGRDRQAPFDALRIPPGVPVFSFHASGGWVTEASPVIYRIGHEGQEPAVLRTCHLDLDVIKRDVDDGAFFSYQLRKTENTNQPQSFQSDIDPSCSPGYCGFSFQHADDLTDPLCWLKLGVLAILAGYLTTYLLESLQLQKAWNWLIVSAESVISCCLCHVQGYDDLARVEQWGGSYAYAPLCSTCSSKSVSVPDPEDHYKLETSAAKKYSPAILDILDTILNGTPVQRNLDVFVNKLMAKRVFEEPGLVDCILMAETFQNRSCGCFSADEFLDVAWKLRLPSVTLVLLALFMTEVFNYEGLYLAAVFPALMLAISLIILIFLLQSLSPSFLWRATGSSLARRGILLRLVTFDGERFERKVAGPLCRHVSWTQEKLETLTEIALEQLTTVTTEDTKEKELKERGIRKIAEAALRQNGSLLDGLLHSPKLLQLKKLLVVDDAQLSRLVGVAVQQDGLALEYALNHAEYVEMLSRHANEAVTGAPDQLLDGLRKKSADLEVLQLAVGQNGFALSIAMDVVLPKAGLPGLAKETDVAFSFFTKSELEKAVKAWRGHSFDKTMADAEAKREQLSDLKHKEDAKSQRKRIEDQLMLILEEAIENQPDVLVKIQSLSAEAEDSLAQDGEEHNHLVELAKAHSYGAWLRYRSRSDACSISWMIFRLVLSFSMGFSVAYAKLQGLGFLESFAQSSVHKLVGMESMKPSWSSLCFLSSVFQPGTLLWAVLTGLAAASLVFLLLPEDPWFPKHRSGLQELWEVLEDLDRDVSPHIRYAFVFTGLLNLCMAWVLCCFCHWMHQSFAARACDHFASGMAPLPFDAMLYFQQACVAIAGKAAAGIAASAMWHVPPGNMKVAAEEEEPPPPPQPVLSVAPPPEECYMQAVKLQISKHRAGLVYHLFKIKRAFHLKITQRSGSEERPVLIRKTLVMQPSGIWNGGFHFNGSFWGHEKVVLDQDLHVQLTEPATGKRWEGHVSVSKPIPQDIKVEMTDSRRPEHKALLDLKLRLHLPHHDPLPQWSHDPIFP